MFIERNPSVPLDHPPLAIFSPWIDESVVGVEEGVSRHGLRCVVRRLTFVDLVYNKYLHLLPPPALHSFGVINFAASSFVVIYHLVVVDFRVMEISLWKVFLRVV